MLTTDRFKQDLLTIVAAASTIPERNSRNFIPARDSSDEKAYACLDAWCQALYGKDWEQHRDRIAQEIGRENIRLLDAVQLRDDALLPSWVDILQEVLHYTDDLPAEETVEFSMVKKQWQFLNQERHVPFGEILAPFVVVARQKLTSQSGAAFSLLSEEAHLALQRDLLHSLVSFAVDTLQLEFSNERSQIQEQVDEWTHYLRFVRQMRSEKLVGFFHQYSMLARLLATVTELWVSANRTFLQHLAADWSTIQHIFNDHHELGQVIALQPSLSEHHNGRQCTMALTLASGKKVVYKPKNIGLEEAYSRLLTWCNAQGIPLPLKVLPCINRSDYGWIEYVKHQSCTNPAEVQRYYQRAGMLLCLVYLLGGIDCFSERMIADGEHPILVDPRTFMHLYPYLGSGAQAPLSENEQLTYSVLHTGLLTTWQEQGRGEKATEISGLGVMNIAPPAPQQERSSSNGVSKKPGRGKNMPMLGGIPQRLEQHAEDVRRGFQQLYTFFQKQRELLLTPHSPLYDLADQQVRFIFRPTWMYKTLCEELHAPMFLRDGIGYSLHLTSLWQTIIPFEDQLWGRGERAPWWPLFLAEVRMLGQGDMPVFTARACDNALIIYPGQEIEGCLQGPSFDHVIARLKELNDEHLQEQVKLLQAVLSMPTIPLIQDLPAANHADKNAYLASVPTTEELTAPALAIAEQIAGQAVQRADGSFNWITAQYLMRSERHQMRLMGYDLFKGLCGVALFLAALENVTGGVGYRPFVLGAVRSVAQALQDTRRHMAAEMGIGGAIGLGSVIYALTRISQFVDEPEILASASQAAREITDEVIASDKALDVIAGAAGAILGLMTLYETTSEQDILDRANRCGQHLLRARRANEIGYRAWPIANGICTTGFSHGAAGIAYALLRLYSATQESTLYEAATEGFAYEDRLFSAETGNWQDMPMEQPPFMTTWCHGAPGIGLARLGVLSVLDTPQIRKDIDIALATTQQCSLQGPDHLCCGNLGRADFLLTASSQLSRPELHQEARRKAWQVVQRAEQRGSFVVNIYLPRWVFTPDLFQGMAGIGYELLRLVYPDHLPSVLLWQ